MARACRRVTGTSVVELPAVLLLGLGPMAQVLCSQEAWEAVQDSLVRTVQQLQQEEEEEEEHKRQAAAAAVLAGAGGGDGSGDDGEALESSGGGGGGRGGAAGGGGVSGRASARTSALTPTRSGVLRSLGFAEVQQRLRAVTGLKLSSGGGGGATAGAGLPLSPPPPPSSVPGGVRAAGTRPPPAGVQRRSMSANNMTAVAAAVAAPIAALRQRMSSFTVAKSGASGTAAAFTAAAAVAVAGESVGGSVRDGRLALPASPLGTASGAAALAPGAPPDDHSGLLPPSLSLGIQGPPSPGQEDPQPIRALPLALPSHANLPPSLTLLSDPGRASHDSTAQGTVALQAPAAPPPHSSSCSGRLDLEDSELPTREWQALCTLVGPQLQLPRGMRLHAKLLGSYSLKGVREEMKLYEVVWVAEVPAAALGGLESTMDGTVSGGITRAATACSLGHDGGDGGGGGGGDAKVTALGMGVEGGGTGLPQDASIGTAAATAVAAAAGARGSKDRMKGRRHGLCVDPSMDVSSGEECEEGLRRTLTTLDVPVLAAEAEAEAAVPPLRARAALTAPPPRAAAEAEAADFRMRIEPLPSSASLQA